MTTFFTQCRVNPLESNEKHMEKNSLRKSLSHDFRKYNEEHIDKNEMKKNKFIGAKNMEEFYDKLNEIKGKYKMVQKNTNIDVANYLFNVRKEFFDSNEKKEIFMQEVNKFLKKECGEDAVLSVIGHDDEDGFHVHAYAVPLHETRRKNRHGEKKEIMINYRGKYAHKKKELVLMQINKQQSETKTGKLQTRWAEHIRKQFPELKRGIPDPERKHITPKEFRRKMQIAIPKMEEKINTIAMANSKLLDRQESIKEEIEKMNKEREKIEKDVIGMEIQRKEIEEDMKEKKKEIEKMLRSIHPLEVAKLFGERNYPPTGIDSRGKERKIHNAFDYLLYCKKFSFAEAQVFLMENFPPERFGRTMVEVKDEMNVDRKKIWKSTEKHVEVKRDYIRKTFEALGNPPVRVTVAKSRQKGYNLSKKKGEEKETFWNYLDVTEKIPALSKYNSDGWNIYITPVEFGDFGERPKKISLLIDDVEDTETVEKQLGEANLIVETSFMNHQMVYIIDNPIDYNGTKKQQEKQRMLINEVFRNLNKEYGDEKISGLRHCMRLPGFGNKKPGREDFFVRLVKSSPNAVHKISEIVREKFNSAQNNFQNKKEEFSKDIQKISEEIKQKVKIVAARKASEILNQSPTSADSTSDDLSM